MTPCSHRDAVGVALGVLLAALALSGPASAQTLGSNGLYDVAVEADGEYTARTGPAHPGPVGVNVLYNGDVLDPWTSWNSLRSYDSGTEYVLRGSPASAASGFTCRTISGLAAPTLETLSDGVQDTGVRLTWQVANGQDSFEAVQEVNAEGTAFENSVVRVTLCVTNTAAAPLRLGMRFLFDWQIGEQDGAYIGVRPPNPPAEPYLGSENFWRPPGFSYYEVSDQQVPSVTPSLYRVAGTVNGPALSPPPTPPDWVQYIDWPTANGECFLALTAGRDIGAADSCVTYYWGYNEAAAIELAPGESFCATQYLFLYESEPPPLCDVQPDLVGGSSCAPGTVTLDASGSSATDCGGVVEYLFTDPDGRVAQGWSTDATLEADFAGTWTVEVRCSDSPNCTASASAEAVIVDPVPVLAGGTACMPEAVTLDASGSLAGGCSGPLEYRFLRPDGTPAGDWAASPQAPADETGTWTVEVRCASLPDCVSSTTAEVVLVEVAAVLAGGQGCAPEPAWLDASASSEIGCPGGLEYRFLDPSGAVARDWSTDPAAAADSEGEWTVEARCADSPDCASSDSAAVRIEVAPAPFAVVATDLDPCNPGLLLEWPADWAGAAWGTNGTGTFSVHRSELSCEDALMAPAIASGLTEARFEDRSGVDGRPYWYAVVAEAATAAEGCPGGPERGAPFTTACLDAPATDLVVPPPPESIGAALRVRRPQTSPVLEWTLGPALRPFETDFVLRSLDPQDLALLVDGVLERSYEDDAAVGDLLFYKVYRRNGCGDVSDD